MKSIYISVISFLLFFSINSELFAQSSEEESEYEIIGTATVSFICSGMREQPSAGSDVFVELDKGKTVQLYDFYQEPYLKISVDSQDGFVSRACLESSTLITNLMYQDDHQMLGMIRRHGERNAKRIREGEVWVGMTEEMLIESWGTPNSKNITESRFGRSEQWVYRKGQYQNDYIYLRDGEVESIQIRE